ncbi:MAG TPA: hypothetical protein VER32_08750 [Pyrinomonadaceae bacterium]|nr:hypothetical protein [Pyrinomonadaceae bacterium]
MSRHQFRLLVVANQLLMLGGYFVRDASDAMLPPELLDYVGGGPSVVEGRTLVEWPYYFWLVLNLATLAAAVGLCLGRRWARTLYLACFVVSVPLPLLTPVYLDTAWTVLVGALYGATEGMILALAYFSHLRRMFDRRGRFDEGPDDESEEDDGDGADARRGA